MTTDLEELLARATALEEKQAVREDEDDWDDGDVDLVAVSSAPGEDPQADADAAGVEAFMWPPVVVPAADELLDDEFEDELLGDELDELDALADQLELEADADDDGEKGYDFDELVWADDLEEKGSGGNREDDEERDRGAVTQEERDYVRDQLGKFASGGQSDSDSDSGGGSRSDGGDASGRQHVVKEGDTLWDIAERELGDGNRWKEIRDASGLGKDFDPKLLQIGTKLDLPPRDKGKGLADLETKDIEYVTLSELELLQARRAQLDA